jgi:hypothetical protein
MQSSKHKILSSIPNTAKQYIHKFKMKRAAVNLGISGMNLRDIPKETSRNLMNDYLER